MRERACELKATASGGRTDGESDVLAKTAERPEADRAMAERLHALITTVAPSLEPPTRYGMPAYVKDGKVLCHFQSAAKFKARYATLGLSDGADLDEGNLWPVAYALTALTPDAEERIAEFVKRATGEGVPE
jgi:uncharacterized protein YdhG (YjbR/CyaY superfamily)